MTRRPGTVELVTADLTGKKTALGLDPDDLDTFVEAAAEVFA